MMVVALSAAGCSGSSRATGSCNLTTSVGYCQDYTNWDPNGIGPYRTACTDNGGTWSDSTCTHASAVGGCRMSSALGDLTNWFYEGGPYDAAMAREACESGTSDSMFVAP